MSAAVPVPAWSIAASRTAPCHHAMLQQVKVVPTSVPSGVEDILDELSKEEGIQEVVLGRQADVQHTVSQVRGEWLAAVLGS